MTENLFKKNISEIYEDIKRTFKEKDYSKLLDYFILLLFLSTIIFIVTYKVSIHLEKWLFSSSYLVLSDRIKGYLPQLMLCILLITNFLKWVLYVKTGKGDIHKTEKETKDTIDFRWKNKVYIIKKNTIYTIGLMLIIFIFIASKISYWDIPFTHNHPLKYNTYVDAALSMYKKNDPFFYQLKYMNNPVTNSLGISKQFGNLPLLEWLLFIAYKLFPKILSLEAITRMVMLIIGATGLVCCYKFTKKAFNQQIGILTVFLLSINAIFNLSFFVTVYDAINFCLTFSALSLLIDNQNTNNTKNLVYSALLIGIGASIKENILIWTAPFVFIYLFIKHKDNIKIFISKIFIYVVSISLPYLITKVSINYFPFKELKYYILFFVLMILLRVFIHNIEKIYSFIKVIMSNLVNHTNKHKYLLLLIPISILLVIKLVYSMEISEEFLTDFTILFNPDLYQHFIIEQLIPYTNLILFYFVLFFIPLFILYNKDKKADILIFSLLLSCLFYLIIASKSLFFHSYYWLFILTFIAIFLAWGISFTKEAFYPKWIRNIYMILLIGTIFLYAFPYVKSKLNRQYPEITEVVEYINSEEFEIGTSFIDQANASYLTIKTDLYRVYDNTEVFISQQFIDSVHEIGFLETMRKYKISYIITLGTDPDFSIFAESLLSEENKKQDGSKRTSLILSALYGETTEEDTGIEDYTLELNHIDDQFKLIKDFGQYRVYKLADACFKTVIE